MQLLTFDQVNPEFLEAYRTERELSLERFWGEVGCSPTRGLRYETKKTEIPEVVKRLVFLHYGLGIPTDCNSDEFQLFVDSLRNGKTLTLSKVIGLLGQVNNTLGQANALLMDVGTQQ